MQSLLLEAGVTFDSGFISIPDTIKQVKLDVGLSYSAPQTQIWLSNEPNLLVFGFEPNPESVQSIKSQSNKKRAESHGDVLNTEYLIQKKAYIIQTALGNKEYGSIPFYITKNDAGCSSLFKPKDEYHIFEKRIEVPVYKLSSFFKFFPFHKIPYISFLKIDAQGSDLDILIGAEHYLSQYVVYITVESDGFQYEGADHDNEHSVYSFLTNQGFIRVRHPNTTDPTYINSKYTHLSNLFIYQRG